MVAMVLGTAKGLGGCYFAVVVGHPRATTAGSFLCSTLELFTVLGEKMRNDSGAFEFYPY